MIRIGVLITAFCFVSAGVAISGETVRQREQRDADQKQIEIRISDFNQRLQRVSAKASEVKEESKREFARVMEELQKKQEELTRKLNALGSADSRDWDRLKTETNAAIEDMNRMCDRLSFLTKGI